MKTNPAARLDPEQHYRDRIARVVAAIVSDPLADRSLDELAALAHFSPFHFHRLYRGITGETVGATVRRLRLARAAQWLAAGAQSVTEIGLAVGYDSPQAFSRAFREFAGIAPRAFQQQRGLAGLALADGAPLARAHRPQALAVEVIERAPERAHGLRHEGPASTIPHTWWRLIQMDRAWPVRYRLGIVSGDTEAGDDEGIEGFTYHAAVVLNDAAVVPSGLVPIEVAGGRYARHVLTGPYTQISAAVAALYAVWLPQSGFEPDHRPMLELYASPPETPPHALRTELLIPIRRLGAA